jgi:signal transduction histidine kinase
MIRDVGRLERLVSGLRELALVDRRIEQVQTASVDVMMLVQAVANRVQGAGDRGVRIDVPHCDSCHVAGDEQSLAQVFENILTNAISFAPTESTVELRVSQKAGACCVAIADRGPGLPELHLQRVFDRFFSYRPGDGAREHLGLGLAIAKRIVEGHGGTITAANRPDGGAVFELRLPLLIRSKSAFQD